MEKMVIITGTKCSLHDNGFGHPESPERILALMKLFEQNYYFGCEHLYASEVSHENLERVHKPEYIKAVLENVPETGHFEIQPDTVLSPHSGAAALQSAGAVVDATKGVLDASFDVAFCAVRPPGHHAEDGCGMGFCFFNNIAVGVEYALSQGVEKIGVIDFDVHHGNGTQKKIAEHNKGVRFYSTHDALAWPCTGLSDEHGLHNNITNMPLPVGAGSKEFREAWKPVIHELESNCPDVIFISAGFDAHRDDPLASICAHENDFGWLTAEIHRVAKKNSSKIVSSLEGGYNPDALTRSVQAHIEALKGKTDFPLVEHDKAKPDINQNVEKWLKAANERLEKKLPAGLFFTMIQYYVDKFCCGDYEAAGTSLNQMLDIRDKNLKCLGQYFSTSLDHALEGRPVLAEETIRYVTDIVRVLSKSPYPDVVNGIPNVKDYIDLEDKNAYAYYRSVAAQYKAAGNEHKSSAFDALADIAGSKVFQYNRSNPKSLVQYRKYTT